MHLFATHFGTYEVGADATGKPKLLPFRHDPDPSEIGLGYLDLADHPQRVRKPMVRKSWLEQGPLAGTGRLRGKDEFVEVTWSRATGLVAGEVDALPPNMAIRRSSGALMAGPAQAGFIMPRAS